MEWIWRSLHPNEYLYGSLPRRKGEGWECSVLQLLQEKCLFIAAFLLQFPCFRRLLVTLALLGIPLEQE
jgi:hypothetical protein